MHRGIGEDEYVLRALLLAMYIAWVRQQDIVRQNHKVLQNLGNAVTKYQEGGQYAEEVD
jgi:hypothetical protein